MSITMLIIYYRDTNLYNGTDVSIFSVLGMSISYSKIDVWLHAIWPKSIPYIWQC